MAMTTTEIETLRDKLKVRYPTLFATKTDTEIEALIGYADEEVNENCSTRLLVIEYLVCYWVDTDGNSTATTGTVTGVEVGDVKTTFSSVSDEDSSVYSSNYYGQLYEDALKRCITSNSWVIA